MDPFEFIIASMAIAGTFITIWVVLLYRRKEKQQPREAGDSFDLAELSALARSMDDRIETLESILDAEVPGWREGYKNEHK